MRPLHEIAADVRRTWPRVNYAARPYLDAISTMSVVSEAYGCDSGKSVVLYFLANAGTWRGEDARRIKAELNVMVKEAK